MVELDLPLALAAVQRHFEAGRMSLDEYEAARMLLTALTKQEQGVKTAIPLPKDGRKTAPYKAFSPELAQELGRRRDVPTPYQPPLTTSQHTLSTPPSNIPPQGPNTGRQSRANLVLSQTDTKQTDTPLATTLPQHPTTTTSSAELEGHHPIPVLADDTQVELGDLVTALKDLAELRRLEILSQEEYQATKGPLLRKIKGVFLKILQERGSTEFPQLLAELLTQK